MKVHNLSYSLKVLAWFLLASIGFKILLFQQHSSYSNISLKPASYAGKLLSAAPGEAQAPDIVPASAPATVPPPDIAPIPVPASDPPAVPVPATDLSPVLVPDPDPAAVIATDPVYISSTAASTSVPASISTPTEAPVSKAPQELRGNNYELKNILESHAGQNWSKSENCSPYPRYEDIQTVEKYYQYTPGGNVSYYFYGAYYDRRHALKQAPRIALLAMISSIPGPFEKSWCQVWYEDSDRPEIMEMERQEISWYAGWGTKPDLVYPVLMSCSLDGGTRRHRVPQLVSMVFKDPCERATNALQVVYEAATRKRATRFAVCLKNIQFPEKDMSERLMEWIELMRLLGAERITAYNMGNGTLLPRTMQTLRYYMEEDGFLELRDHRFLRGHPEPAKNTILSRRLNEVLMYIDCMYRNMYNFDYVAVIDLDEVIMPLGELQNWNTLVEFLERNFTHTMNGKKTPGCVARSSYCFRNVYFPRNLTQDETVPSNLYMLRHVRRVADHLGPNSAIKCLHSTAYNTILHNHFPLSWREACGPYGVPTQLGQLQHYREPDLKNTLYSPPPPRDDNIWRFKDKLIEKTQTVQRQLGWTTT